MNNLPAQKVNGLIDGIAVLQELAMSQEPASGKAIADRLQMNPVRVNRLLKTLAHLGLAYRNTSRRYSVGSAMHVLAAQSMAASGLLKRALPYLKQLRQSGNTVALGVLWKDQVCYLYHNSGKSEFPEGLGRMEIYPAVNSSIGMALLAELSDGQLKATLAQPLSEEFLDSLKVIRKNGCARLWHTDHISAAVPIGIPAYAAIAISGLKTETEADEAVAVLKDISEIISDR
jgi:DNA-binding IclR family transcriptional regulator